MDSADLSKPIANAKFSFEAVDGSWGPVEYTTLEDGTIDLSKLPTGAVVVTELECPGYVIDDAQRIIHLDPNEDAEFVFTNSKLPSLTLTKLSSDGSPLAGVTYSLTRIEDGSRYMDQTTSAAGTITWDGLQPGVYSLKETDTVSNHILDTKEYHVELFPGKDSTIVLENDRRPNLTVVKRDADSGAPIADTVFLVEAADGHSVDEIRTGPDGSATLENLLPGVYQISEKSVPSPYLMDAEPQLVTLYPNRDHTVYFENHKAPTIEIIKENFITHERLINVRFQVWHASGEITAKVVPDIPAIVAQTVHETGYDSDYEIEVITHNQSGDIAEAVDGGRTASPQRGAGDQGIMYGYACLETDELLPLPVVLAHRLTRLLANARKAGTIRGLGPDGKAQVSVEYVFGLPSRIVSVVVSCQHEADKSLGELRREITERVVMPALRELPPDEGTEILINPSGRFVLGGFEADTGLAGRKLMVDTYGGLVPHGGGALSGKDGTKVDRSGAYMARHIAKNIVAAGLAERCTIALAYAIGKAEPVAVDIDTHGTSEYTDDMLEQAVRSVFDLTPGGMIHALCLDRPGFARFCNYGHFTHPDAPWEQTDKAELLAEVCRFKEVGASSR